MDISSIIKSKDLNYSSSLNIPTRVGAFEDFFFQFGSVKDPSFLSSLSISTCLGTLEDLLIIVQVSCMDCLVLGAHVKVKIP